MNIPADFISALVGLVLTLLIFSYLLGDSPLFKLAIYLFVGVSSGYAAAVVWHQVLVQSLFQPLLSGPVTAQDLLLLIPLVLSVLLLMKISPHLSRLGTVSVAFLVGVGAAVAIGGAVLGTILPQIGAGIAPFALHTAAGEGYHWAERLSTGIVAIIGTISTLVYFHFGAKAGPGGGVQRSRLVEWIAWLGRIFIAISLGVLFAGVFAAALTAMIERWDSIFSIFR